MNALENLMSQGIPQKMAERIIAQAQSESKPKTKKKGGFFPGMSSSKTKVDLDIDVLIICECCGATKTEKRTIKALPDSPTEMKTATMLCNECPDYFRKLTHEQLVSLALVRHHAGLMHQCPRDKSQVNMAKKMTPEEIISHRTTHF